MKVPLLVRAPGLKSGVEDRLAQHVDIAPSILGLLGLPAHPSFQGIDLFNSVPDPKHSAYMLVQPRSRISTESFGQGEANL
jgi:arylsulfatase A-like enzyme